MLSKIGFRRSTGNSEKELSKLRKENAYLRKTLDEVSGKKGSPSESQSNRVLLERILALETLREKNSKQILARDQEIARLWQLLRSDSAEVVIHLHAQLNQQREDAEKRESLIQSLHQETEEVKKKLEAVSAKCQERENISKSGTADGHAITGDSTLIQEQLKDALEKNRQWLVYDQQREAYVKAVLAEKHQLEQELHQADKALEEKDYSAEEREKVLVYKLQREQQKRQQLLTRYQKIRNEVEEERLKAAEMRQQVKILQQEEQHRMTVLEQQKAQRKTPQSVPNTSSELDRLPKKNPQTILSPTRAHSLLDESFLECPNCGAQYTTSRHRELLVHIDQCLFFSN